MMSEEPALELRGVERSFRDGTTALRNVSLSIRKGSFTLLLGANGSGKSVLLRIISGLMIPQKGEVLLGGKPLQSYGRDLHQRIGFIFQNPDSQIVGQTVEEDVAFGPRNLNLEEKEVKRRCDTALKLTGLEQLRLKRPYLLSGGEKRRLSIAGAEAMEPDILLLDEPFTNLDYPGSVELLELLLSMKKAGKTIILVTHDLQKTAAHADRIIVLSAGSIVGDGDPETQLEKLEQYGVRAPHPAIPLRDCSLLKLREQADG
jgi:biotin transport system ATP-binding protein